MSLFHVPAPGSAAERVIIVASIVAGIAAYDVWQYRRQIKRFASFVGLWERPARADADRTYRDATTSVTNADHE